MDKVVGANDVLFASENPASIAREYAAKGGVDAWRDAVAQPCIGNPLLIAGVSLAFAGALLEPCSVDGGGIHLRGASSRGKSTIQRVAVSVWGSPRLLVTWRATSNGLEGVASACNSTLLALDEMGEVSSKEAGAVAYMLANGAGKQRANRTGAARAVPRWRTMVLSSGEISLSDKMAEAERRAAAGQQVRLLDIPADRQKHGAFDELHDCASGAEFADQLKQATSAAYGSAGPAFIERFLSDRAASIEKINAVRESFRTEASGGLLMRFREGQVVRAVERLALTAAAGELATMFGLTGWPQGAAVEAALVTLELWLRTRGGDGPDEARQAIERTRAYIAKYGEVRFEEIFAVDGASDANPPKIQRSGYKDQDHYYFHLDAWKELHSGSDPTRAARHLAEAGLLATEETGRLKRRLPAGATPGSERPRAYAVKAAILGYDPQEEDA